MSGYHIQRNGDTVTVLGGRGKEPAARRRVMDAVTLLQPGERLADGEQVMAGWRFRVIPAQTLTLAEVRNGTGFPRGVRFIVVPPDAKGAVQ